MELPMKKISENLYLVDYEQDTLEDIRTAEIGRLKLLKESLQDTDKLCSDIGTMIVAEFDFRGNLNEVQTKLTDLITMYETIKFKETTS